MFCIALFKICHPEHFHIWYLSSFILPLKSISSKVITITAYIYKNYSVVPTSTTCTKWADQTVVDCPRTALGDVVEDHTTAFNWMVLSNHIARSTLEWNVLTLRVFICYKQFSDWQRPSRLKRLTAIYSLLRDCSTPSLFGVLGEYKVWWIHV